ncbi:hypothetical protein [Burkholderia vietnamiensis]|uniref:hypothetical protein n=1 Tax=Burkholderia vietnamiensis TaxID=60552 RepID=UPI001CF1097D|nr:hypothetical protein [Burkholderia vietnamiensis]MCA8232082.1 hypothetical protein [Burkholderia vietnamiensis]
MRAAALLHALAARLGVENPHQFAKRFDELVGTSTQTSGKWRLNFAGSRPLSAQQLKLLCRLDTDAYDLHNHGPADLWVAMWADERDLWRLCRTRLSPLGASLDDRIWSEIADEFVEEKTFDATLSDFENELLQAEAYGEPLLLRQLTEAVALARLFQSLSALALLPIDGRAISRCMHICLNDRNIATELRRYGVLDDVRQEVTDLAATSATGTPVTERSEALTPKLAWGRAHGENFSR